MRNMGTVVLVLLLSCTCFLPFGAYAEAKKVFVLGLDGAAWRVLLPLIDAGYMPNLNQLMKNGIYGVLYSQAAYSPVSWNSIFTGMRPKVHGIDGLYINGNMNCRFRQGLDYGQQKFNICSYDRRAEPAWKIMSDSGKRVGVLGFLTTYPAESINGSFISGDTSPNLLSNKAYHAQLKLVQSESSSGHRVFSGVLLNNEITLTEEKPGEFKIDFAVDPGGQYGSIKAGRTKWIDIPLDSESLNLFATMTDVKPIVQRASWDGFHQSRSEARVPLEISIPSGISPRHHGKHRNRPLFIYADFVGSQGKGHQVQFSYVKDPATLMPVFNMYGFDVIGKISRGFSSFSDGGEIVLEPQIQDGVKLVLSWDKSADDSDKIKDVEYFTGLSGGVKSSDYAGFWEWVEENRRRVYKSPVAFLGMTRAVLQITGETALLDTKFILDSFHRPAYNFVYPSNLLADLDYSVLGADQELEIYRNQNIKKKLFDHVFDPDAYDVFWLCYTATDLSQHYAWNSPDPLDLDLSRYNQLIIDRWILTDEYIGELRNKLGPEWTIVVCSDHGFHKIYNRRKIDFNWNQLLVDLGLLKLSDPPEINWEKIGYQPPRQECYRLTMTFRCNESTKMNIGAR